MLDRIFRISAFVVLFATTQPVFAQHDTDRDPLRVLGEMRDRWNVLVKDQWNYHQVNGSTETRHTLNLYSNTFLWEVNVWYQYFGIASHVSYRLEGSWWHEANDDITLQAHVGELSFDGLGAEETPIIKQFAALALLGLDGVLKITEEEESTMNGAVWQARFSYCLTEAMGQRRELRLRRNGEEHLFTGRFVPDILDTLREALRDIQVGSSKSGDQEDGPTSDQSGSPKATTSVQDESWGAIKELVK